MNAKDSADHNAIVRVTTSVDTVDLLVNRQGHFIPRLTASPEAVTDRSISTIVGQGFPPSDPVLVQILETSVSFGVTPDANGTFKMALSPLGKLPLGNYTLHVDAVTTNYDQIEAQLVVVLPTFKPQQPTERRSAPACSSHGVDETQCTNP